MIKKSLLLLICLINIHIASAQTDTITYAECEIDTNPDQYDKLLKYFLIEKEVVNHLWKFNAVEWGALDPSIAFEQRIKGRSSFQLKGLIGIDNIQAYYKYGVSPLLKAKLSADYRFYYNKNKREKIGKPTNGFSANYLILGAGTRINNRHTLATSTEGNYSYWDISYDIKGGIGLQRRFGSIAYIDFNFGINLLLYDEYEYIPGHNLFIIDSSTQTWAPYADIGIGFALKSLKRPLFK